MQRGITLAAALLLSAVSLAPQTAPPQDAGTIDAVVVPAMVLRGTRVLDASPSAALQMNDVLRTDATGRLRIVLKDGSVLTVGENSELRVVQHDPATQQTLIELLHGRLRAQVTSVTNQGGYFLIRTPTATVVALGTGVQIETSLVQVSTSVNRQMLDNLPSGGREFTTLLDLTPGIDPTDRKQRSLYDYQGVGSTSVMTLDHFAYAANNDATPAQSTYVLPDEYTIIPRGGPPTPPEHVFDASGNYTDPGAQDARKFGIHFGAFDDWQPGGTPCKAGLIINGMPVSPAFPPGSDSGFSPPKFNLKITGGGTSTGDAALQMHISNLSTCAENFMVTDGAVLYPKGLTARIVEVLGGNPTFKDFQRMISWGGLVWLPSYSGLGLTMTSVPPGKEVIVPLHSFCVELHKLAPHVNTEYAFAEDADQKRLGVNQPILDRVFRMTQSGQITLPPGQPMDTLIQWSLWASIEGMNKDKLHDEYFTLMKKNYAAMNKKFDKDAEQQVESQSQNLWTNVDKVLAAKD
jgi:FecR protein